VSKYHPIEAIAQAYEAGQRDFGESKAQDLTTKHAALPPDINWHFIGHLQTNKVKYIAPFIHLIHSIDSYKLLCEVDRQAAKAGRKISCLLQESCSPGMIPILFAHSAQKERIFHVH
jgi:uncharacterized pyridoxal phosphate-containing UPF0001 family protein